MEIKMEPKEKLRKIKENFDDFSLEVMKASIEAKRAEDDVMSERLKAKLEDILKILLSSGYVELEGKDLTEDLETLTTEMAVLGSFLDISLQCKYITKEKHDECKKFIEKCENIIEE